MRKVERDPAFVLCTDGGLFLFFFFLLRLFVTDERCFCQIVHHRNILQVQTAG